MPAPNQRHLPTGLSAISKKQESKTKPKTETKPKPKTSQKKKAEEPSEVEQIAQYSSIDDQEPDTGSGTTKE